MNSIDKAYRDERDVAELLTLCRQTINAWRASNPDSAEPLDFQVRLNTITVRRSVEDAGKPV